MPNQITQNKQSIDNKLQDAKFRPSGFDYMRIILSVMVVASHTINVCYGVEITNKVWASPLGAIMKLILPMFFALSGFLVAGSLGRTKTLVTFLGLRAIRIYPALIVEVFLSALLIGPMVTELPINSYFHGKEFFLYLVNITGHISYLLPGVFDHNPMPSVVNQQLWTVPYELLCYISISVLALFGIRKNKSIIIFGIVIVFLAEIALLLIHKESLIQIRHKNIEGPKLIVFFLSGILLFLYKERIPWNPIALIASMVASPILLFYVPFGDWISVLPVAYLTVGLGVMNPRRLGFIGLADYSYGIFLYGFVLQQTLVYFFPWSRHWYLNLLMSVPLSILVGIASWHLVEKPALKLKNFLKPMEEAWLRGRDYTWGRIRGAVASIGSGRKALDQDITPD